MFETPIKAFRINGFDEYIELYITEVFGFPHQTDFDGGYSVRGYINLCAGCYKVDNGDLWFSTGGLYRLLKQLELCYKNISGEAEFKVFERNFEMRIIFDNKGHVSLVGEYQELMHIDNELRFEIDTDQTQIFEAICDLRKIELEFGDERGVIKK